MRGMSHSVPLVPMALVVVSVMAMAMATSTASAVSTGDFTEAQRIHTLKMLGALPLHTADNAPMRSANTDFCAWPDVACHRLQTGEVGAEVTITQDRRVELPADVDERHVRITAVKVRAGSLPSNSALLSSLSFALSSSLTTLDFTGSHITSELPEMWGRFVSLEHLRLGNNNFYGTLPAAWSALVALKEFRLQNNNVSGTLPAAWSTMTGIQNMTLDNNSFSGTLPSSWSTMTAFTEFSVHGNALCGGVPASWSAMTQLSLSADAALNDSCTASSSSSSSSSSTSSTSNNGAISSGNSASSNAPSPTTEPPTTTEPPSILTNCTATNCLLCPVTAPQLCSVCVPGYAMTIVRTCEATAQNGAVKRMAHGPLVALGVVLAAVVLEVY